MKQAEKKQNPIVSEGKISELKFDDKNFNKHTEFGMSLLEKSLRRNGAGRSIVVDKDNRIIGGNGIVETAANIGLENTIVVETTGDQLVVVKRTDVDLDSKQGREMALADNATAAADFDLDLELIKVTQEEYGFDSKEWGIELIDVEEPEQTNTEATEDDFDEDKDFIAVKCKRGDIWKLGNHRLMCGDSTESNDVHELVGSDKADLALTDPPYGIEASNGVGGFGSSPDKARKYEGDWDNDTPDINAYNLIFENSNHAIIFGGNYMTDKLPIGKHWIVWDKVGSFEFKNPFSDCELAWTNFEKKTVKKYTVVSQGFVQDDKDDKDRLHPTQKSVKMLSMILADYSKEGDKILDLFGGSGSTMMACEQLNRRCYMMELDPHYCDVIIARWEKLTGKQAELINV